MRGIGQAYDSDSGTGVNSSGVSVNPNPPIPSLFGDMTNLPLSSSGSIAPDVAAIPCESGQTCSYIANVPDWALVLGGALLLFGFLYIARAS